MRQYLQTARLWFNESKRFLSKLVLLFFGSFLFVGLLEEYKSHEGLISEIRSSYNEIRKKQNECRRYHNELFLAFYPYSGSLLVLHKEFSQILALEARPIPLEYAAYIQSISTQPKENLSRIETLQKDLRFCGDELLMRYEDLALLLGVHQSFSAFQNDRSAKLNRTYQKQKKSVSDLIPDISYEEFTEPFKRGIVETLRENPQKWPVRLEMLSKAQLEIAKYEEERFRIEEDFFRSYRELVLPRIKSRFNGGFLGWLSA